MPSCYLAPAAAAAAALKCHCSKCGKKATACTFSAGSQHVFFADRFGDVLCAAVTAEPAPPAAAEQQGSSSTALPAAAEAQLLLGHLQCIVSSLATCGSSSGRQLLVSTDKDGKVRASVLHADPTKVCRAGILGVSWALLVCACVLVFVASDIHVWGLPVSDKSDASRQTKRDECVSCNKRSNGRVLSEQAQHGLCCSQTPTWGVSMLASQ